MAQQEMPDNAPGTTLFPQFSRLHDMVSTEVAGLTDEQLDFESDQWGWSQWSIRRQVSHVASLHFRWLLVRWADHNIAQGLPQPEDLKEVAQSSYDRRMDEIKYWSIDALLGKVREAMDLCQAVLARETIGSLRAKQVVRDNTPQWRQMAQAHPKGVRERPKRSQPSLDDPGRHLPTHVLRRHHSPLQHPAAETGTRIDWPGGDSC